MHKRIILLTCLSFLLFTQKVQATTLIRQNGTVVSVAGVVLGDEVTPTPEVDEYWKRPSPVVDDYKNRPTWYPGATRPPTWTPITRAPTWSPDHEPTRYPTRRPEPSRKPELHITPWITRPPTPTKSLTPKPTRTMDEYRELYLKIRDSKGKETTIDKKDDVVVETKTDNFRLKENIPSQTIEMTRGEDKLDIKLPVIINSDTKQVSVGTSSGREVEIKVELHDAIEKTLQHLDLQDTVPPQEVGSSIVEDNGKVVYKLETQKRQKLFGFLPVKVEETTTLDAQSGELVRSEKSFANSLLDFFSF